MPARTIPLAALALALGFAGSGAATTYSITDLGTLGGSQSNAYGINAAGTVVGSATTVGNAAIRPVQFAGNQITNLGSLGGAIVNQANAINVHGVAVGTCALPGNTSAHAFASLGGTLVDLGTLGGASSFANAINDAGQIAGHAQTGSATHAYRYESGQMTDLGTLGGTASFAYGINDAGHVVGQASTGSALRAFVFISGSPTNLGTLGSGSNSVAYAVNDNDQIVGASNIVNGGPDHPFLYQNGQMTDLGTLGGSSGTAYAINLSSQIVGESTTPNDAATHAFLFQGGQITDLNTFVPNSGWVLTTARAINAKGQIAGTGTLNGATHAFLLSPVVPIDPVATAPRIYINGSKRITTSKSTIRVEGSVGGTVKFVKYRLDAKGSYRPAKGHAGWRVTVKLHPGRNIIQVIAVGPTGKTSKPARLAVFRTS